VYKRDYAFRMNVMEETFEIRSCITNQWLGIGHVLSNETRLVLVTDEKGLFHRGTTWGPELSQGAVAPLATP